MELVAAVPSVPDARSRSTAPLGRRRLTRRRRAPRAPRRLACVLALAAAAVAAISCPAAVRAAVTPEAAAVIARHVEALGGRAAVEGVRAVRAKATLSAFGLIGRTESWTRLPDRRASETALGPLTLREGFDGRTAWRTDPGGKLVVLDGKDRENAVGSAWFENDRWLEPDQGGGNAVLAGTERDSAGTYDVLEVTPPAGRSRRLFVHRDTGLLDRVVGTSDRQTVVTTLWDYRAVDGRRFAFATRIHVEGMPANDATVAVDSLWVNPEISDSRFAPPGPIAATVRYLKTPGRARIPFDYGSRHLWVKVSVNGGPPEDFIFDTGASITVIDSAYAAKIGLASEGHLQGQGAGSVGSAAFATLKSLAVRGQDGDGVEMADQQVAVLGINPFIAPFFWRDVAGVLGFNFIHQFVNEIDYDAGALTLYDPATFEYRGPGAAIPMTLAGTVPAVRMTLDGRYDGDFRVDVGSSATLDLHTPFVEKHGLLGKVGRTIEITGGGFGGTFQSRLCRMDSLRIGPYAWERPLVGLSAATTGALASEDYAGNVGNQILDRFKCTFDYEHRRLYLEPGSRYRATDRFSRAGMQLARFGDTVQVMQVIPGSPAEKAGLEQGDVVTAIDGKPVLSYTPDSLLPLLEQGRVGSRVRFEVLRGGKSSTLKLKLADII
ncbi:MAG: hypothetical protein A2W00_02230 [Candidatus Eisenbacteria bacterium RBG_16_71_46]|nr:MAG: hypothetical protein A2W00_02230 [Candidatus Eisenbacteria bacterium RBG_16_71_46]OGF20990.1 MAG: hypothetical protein A2V63_02230 [Candidatus Eisenbacteria bacterium RBG_19FT_COMBO_70_11]